MDEGSNFGDLSIENVLKWTEEARERKKMEWSGVRGRAKMARGGSGAEFGSENGDFAHGVDEP